MARKKSSKKRAAKRPASKGASKRGAGKTPAERVTTSRRSSGMAAKKGSSRLPEFQPPPNDNLSNAFDRMGLVPEKYRGTDQFLDIVCWNIRFFHDQDPDRVKRIVNVLSELNADIIVLEEIKNLSLDAVAQGLKTIEAGFYETAYGTTGGDQRVSMMYDLDWIRAKDDIRELFGKGQVMVGNKDAFPRLPLHSSFTGLSQEAPFDFQLVGLHLKSQRGGGKDQRERAAAELKNWLINDAPAVDADVILLGDWNEPPNSDTWHAFHDLESEGLARFDGINNESEISHLMYKNKSELGSRLDLAAVSMSADERMGEPPQVVRWAPLDEFLGTDPKATEIKKFLKEISDSLSDHLPVVTRFYFTDEEP